MVSKIWEFEIPHVGWEMDNQGWIEDNNGTLELITTNHDSREVMTMEALDRKIKEVTEWRSGLMKARDVMGGY